MRNLKFIPTQLNSLRNPEQYLAFLSFSFLTRKLGIIYFIGLLSGKIKWHGTWHTVNTQ